MLNITPHMNCRSIISFEHSIGLTAKRKGATSIVHYFFPIQNKINADCAHSNNLFAFSLPIKFCWDSARVVILFNILLDGQ